MKPKKLILLLVPILLFGCNESEPQKQYYDEEIIPVELKDPAVDDENEIKRNDLYIIPMAGLKWREIGFKKESFVIDCLKGMGICVLFYAIAFTVEFAVLNAQGTPGHLEFYVTGFSLTGGEAKYTGIGFVLMCIGFNIINVWMEEGLFRGFYITYISRERSENTALWTAAILFGIWHLVTPIRSLIDGDMTIAMFFVMSFGYVILSAVMGIKWGLLYQMSGTVWIGVADHFFNNCVVTNLLHVVTNEGSDELQIVRVMIGELTSFAAVLVYYKIRKRRT